jgi:hypothetical protein
MSEDQHQIILDHFGKDAVLLKMAEECNELSAAICKMNIAEKNDDTNEHGKAFLCVLEEFADVLEVSERLRLFLDMETVKNMRIFKRSRTLEKIYDQRKNTQA